METQQFLLTGGSRGIWGSEVNLVREAGHDVVFMGRDEVLIGRVAQEAGACGIRADVSVGDDNSRTVEVCRERMGGIDVLVNNVAFGY